jgi:hypothetical protein
MDKISKIFKEMKQVEPKRELESLILQKIGLEREKQAKRKLFLSYAGITSSAFATFFMAVALWDSFFQSEFWSMLSLIFSDLMIVAENWKTYSYSLAETFPVFDIVAILIPIFGLLAFLNLLMSIKNRRHADKYANANLQFQH